MNIMALYIAIFFGMCLAFGGQRNYPIDPVDEI
jgi:hypothetical protein